MNISLSDMPANQRKKSAGHAGEPVMFNNHDMFVINFLNNNILIISIIYLGRLGRLLVSVQFFNHTGGRPIPVILYNYSMLFLLLGFGIYFARKKVMIIEGGHHEKIRSPGNSSAHGCALAFAGRSR